LACGPKKIALIEGDTALTPNQGGTGGSNGIMVGGMQIRQAGGDRTSGN
jgi:CO/xanthine dehydrogenase Mo-binding subunit